VAFKQHIAIRYAKQLYFLFLSFLFYAVALTAAFAQSPGACKSASARKTVGQRIWLGGTTPFLDATRLPEWLKGLSISGFLQNTSGTWVNASGLTNFGRAAGEHHGANSLAVERNLLQLDVNYLSSGDNSGFLRFWGVYEPPYPWEAHNIAGPDLVYDKSQSSFYNRYDVRDAYWKHVSGLLTLFLGHQIVTWGESLAFRVGDVVNPQDLSWNFGFANLEQSRLPLWMVHPIINLPSWKGSSSNFLEGIWCPAWQPIYDGPNYADRRYSGQYNVAGAVNLLPPSGGRFDAYPYPFTAASNTPPGQEAAFPQITNLQSFQQWLLPSDSWKNSTGGMRVHTLLANYEITLFYWHAHQFNPTSFVEGSPRTGQFIEMRYPQFNDVGLTANRPLYLTPRFLAELPLVLRAETVWQDDTPFNTVDIDEANAVRHSSTLNTLLALDIDQVPMEWLSETGSLTTNLEWNNYTIVSPSKHFVYGGYAESWRHNEENFLLSATTSWWWGAIEPTATAIYNPDGDTWELFPNIEVTPPWTSKYFVNLQYIGVVSNDKFSAYAGGVFKGKNILLIQFQYDFDLIHGRS
jgi:hypothetical protein